MKTEDGVTLYVIYILGHHRNLRNKKLFIWFRWTKMNKYEKR